LCITSRIIIWPFFQKTVGRRCIKTILETPVPDTRDVEELLDENLDDLLDENSQYNNNSSNSNEIVSEIDVMEALYEDESVSEADEAEDPCEDTHEEVVDETPSLEHTLSESSSGIKRTRELPVNSMADTEPPHSRPKLELRPYLCRINYRHVSERNSRRSPFDPLLPSVDMAKRYSFTDNLYNDLAKPAHVVLGTHIPKNGWNAEDVVRLRNVIMKTVSTQEGDYLTRRVDSVKNAFESSLAMCILSGTPTFPIMVINPLEYIPDERGDIASLRDGTAPSIIRLWLERKQFVVKYVKMKSVGPIRNNDFPGNSFWTMMVVLNYTAQQVPRLEPRINRVVEHRPREDRTAPRYSQPMENTNVRPKFDILIKQDELVERIDERPPSRPREPKKMTPKRYIGNAVSSKPYERRPQYKNGFGKGPRR